MKVSPITVELVDVMGSDLTVVNAARVSMSKHHETLQDNDEALIRYLAQHNHWSPFAHAQITFRIKAPIFIARQLVKHQVGLVWNEVSRRYVSDPPEYYVPMLRERAENVKQGSKDEEVAGAAHMKEGIRRAMAVCHHTYLSLLNKNVAPEVARAILPLNMMTEWYWTGSLFAFARVCNLRLDPHAQKEAQEVAKKILEFLKEKFPLSIKELVYYVNV